MLRVVTRRSCRRPIRVPEIVGGLPAHVSLCADGGRDLQPIAALLGFVSSSPHQHRYWVDLTIEELWEIDPQFACMGKFHALRFTDFNKFSKEA